MVGNSAVLRVPEAIGGTSPLSWGASVYDQSTSGAVDKFKDSYGLVSRSIHPMAIIAVIVQPHFCYIIYTIAMFYSVFVISLLLVRSSSCTCTSHFKAGLELGSN